MQQQASITRYFKQDPISEILKKCEKKGHGTRYLDEDSGELVCTDCGLVLETMNLTSEPRNFDERMRLLREYSEELGGMPIEVNWKALNRKQITECLNNIYKKFNLPVELRTQAEKTYHKVKMTRGSNSLQINGVLAALSIMSLQEANGFVSTNNIQEVITTASSSSPGAFWIDPENYKFRAYKKQVHVEEARRAYNFIATRSSLQVPEFTKDTCLDYHLLQLSESAGLSPKSLFLQREQEIMPKSIKGAKSRGKNSSQLFKAAHILSEVTGNLEETSRLTEIPVEKIQNIKDQIEKFRERKERITKPQMEAFGLYQAIDENTRFDLSTDTQRAGDAIPDSFQPSSKQFHYIRDVCEYVGFEKPRGRKILNSEWWLHFGEHLKEHMGSNGENLMDVIETSTGIRISDLKYYRYMFKK